jgi:integrase
MATGKVTKRAVDAIKPAAKDAFLWDDEEPGFGVKATPAGQRCSCSSIALAVAAAPVRRYTIGKFGTWTPDEARAKAKTLRKLVDDGIDPVAERTTRIQAATEFTVNAVCDRFITECLRKKWKKAHPLAERTLRNHVLPKIGNRPIASLHEGDIEDVLQAIPDERKGARRNTYVVMRRFFSWAVDRRDIPLNISPLAKVDAPDAPDERDHVLADWELRLAWEAAGSIGYPFGPLYRLLMLNGQRREEVGGLDWRELDRASAQWELPAARAKNGVANTIHLTALMIAELDAIAGGDKWPKRGLVFTTTGETAVSGHSRGKRRLDSAMAALNAKQAEQAGEDPTPVAPFRVHDFRRTMATGMQRLGFRWEVIEACENRISGQARKGAGSIYQRHDWGPEKKLAWEAWSKRVDQLATRSDETNVVRLAEARA